MIKYYKAKLSTHIADNKFKYLLSIISLLVGLSIGIANASKAEASAVSYIDTFFSSYIIGGTSSSSVFFKSVLLNLRTFGIIWLSGWFVWLVPLNFLEVGAKGYSIGYAYTFFILSEHLKGLAFSLITLLLQNMIVIPSIVIYSVIQLNFAIRFDKVYKSQALYKERKRLIIGNMIILAVILILLLICGYIEGFITPFLLKFMA